MVKDAYSNEGERVLDSFRYVVVVETWFECSSGMVVGERDGCGAVVKRAFHAFAYIDLCAADAPFTQNAYVDEFQSSAYQHEQEFFAGFIANARLHLTENVETAF